MRGQRGGDEEKGRGAPVAFDGEIGGSIALSGQHSKKREGIVPLGLDAEGTHRVQGQVDVAAAGEAVDLELGIPLGQRQRDEKAGEELGALAAIDAGTAATQGTADPQGRKPEAVSQEAPSSTRGVAAMPTGRERSEPSATSSVSPSKSVAIGENIRMQSPDSPQDRVLRADAP